MGNLAHSPRFGTGSQAREDRSNIRHRKEVKGWTDFPDTPFLPGREQELPECPPGFEWAPQTITWWDHIRTMPHASAWSDTDWSYAKATAFVHTMFWNGTITAAPELRMRERLMGCTWESRRAASIRYVPVEGAAETAALASVPEPAAPATPISAAPSRKPRVRAIDPEARA
jgi:hypothetical protein